MKLEKNLLLSRYTTIRIGGLAKYMAFPENGKQVKECLRIAQWEGIPLFVLGRGANTIFGNFEGIVVNTKMLRRLKVREDKGGLEVIAQAGVPLSTIVELGVKENLEGIYKLGGFPATVGGAIAMNAGAFGYEISQHLKAVKFLSYEGEEVLLSKEDLGFSYRSSPFPSAGIVLEAIFFFPKLNHSVYEEYEKIKIKRKESQPIQMPTAGSTFKNPSVDSAGRLLEKVGMKGYRVGRVALSEKHANFLINLGGAVLEDVIKIIAYAKERVFEAFGIELEEEVRIIESSSADGWKVCGT